MITHPVAAPRHRLRLQRSAVVMDVFPARFAGRQQLRKPLSVEVCPMLSPEQSQTVIIDLDLHRQAAPGHGVTSV
jgi:hypothetical protein